MVRVSVGLHLRRIGFAIARYGPDERERIDLPDGPNLIDLFARPACARKN
jgi:hypothetical protein